jgi:hypothetical protein
VPLAVLEAHTYASPMNVTTARVLLATCALAALSLPACGGDDGGDGGGDAATGGRSGTGGSPGASGSPATSTVSYKADVAPIFASKCNYCHHPGAAIDVDLTDPFDPDHGLVGRPNTWVPNGSKQTLLVDPGNVDNSFLITKVVETDLDAHVDGAPMPLQQPAFSDEELADVEQWIGDGANDDDFFASNVAPLFGTEVTLGSRSGRCTFCHYPGTPFGFSVLDVFDATTGMVGVNSRSAPGKKIVAPGEPEQSSLLTRLRGEGGLPRMPLAPSRVTDAEAQLLRSWVAEGALDN